MLYLFGIFTSFYLFTLLLLKRNQSFADRMLSIWMVVMGLHQVIHYLDYAKISYQYPHLLGLGFALPLLHGVLLYFYVLALTAQKQLSLKLVLPHFIPFILLIGLAIPFYALSGKEKIEVFSNHGAGYEWYSLTQISLIILSGTAYVVWSLVLIRRSQLSLKKWHLQWLQYLSIGLAAIWMLVLFFDDGVIFSGVSLLVLLIGILGINQVPVFSGHFESNFTERDRNKMVAESSPVRYAKSGLKADASDELFARLELLMEKEAVYKNNELTLSELAAMLDVHANSLSQVINEKVGKNFYNYINTLRVGAFINLAAQPDKQHYSLLALAFECGFNSKSTFNKYFKAVMGETPSAHFGLLRS
ncbi:helix-turn-helix domain-containing protein [Haliscomenobacter hydrossis]|uniref:Helix-turn-helix, AraC domain protein n=1 Tax=Haliscomenobacter hydrossis (strain ATCC 27775 / DSM 1100 / LMG 10767 / O) TaxID=760192 RepID=F4KZG7_HALH1|nr:helix-turn-helix domain-containing protein [Haliscomenobacter hydrossis]AEE49437.1 Helix-turn-helix, AraC domain protein [Haliscomenobacter hydrossis DSM 1100]